MQIHQLINPLLIAATAAAWATSSAKAVQPTPRPLTSFTLISEPPAADTNFIDGSYLGYSLDPAFWNEFIGRNKEPNQFTFSMFKNLDDRTGVSPYLRPGGNTQDSTIFDATSNGTAERVTGASGQVYSTTYGRGYYESWENNFPRGWKIISTLDLKNNSFEIARDEAIASARYAPQRIAWFELGNEPTLYNGAGANPWCAGHQEFRRAVGELDSAD